MPCDSARLGFLGTQRTNHQTDEITVENEAIRSRSHAMTESTERNAEKRKETLLPGEPALRRHRPDSYQRGSRPCARSAPYVVDATSDNISFYAEPADLAASAVDDSELVRLLPYLMVVANAAPSQVGGG